MGECDGSDPRRVLGLRVAQPAQLRRGERCNGHESRAAGVLIRSDFGDQVERRLRAARVVPEQRGPDDLAGLVEDDHPVLLAGHGDRGDIVETTGVGDCGLECIPPELRVDLGAVRVGRAARPHVRPRLEVAHDDLAALGG